MDSPKRASADIDVAEKRDGEMMHMSAPYTPEEEKALVRKIDMFILPFVRGSCVGLWVRR